MPSGKTTLWLADINNKHQLHSARTITHAQSDHTSIFQPEWSPESTLYFVSDLTGWWNIYRYKDDSIQTISHQTLEFGLPQWVFAQSSYAFIDANHILCAPIDNGIAGLAVLDTSHGTLTPIDTEWNSFSSIQAIVQFQMECIEW